MIMDGLGSRIFHLTGFCLVVYLLRRIGLHVGDLGEDLLVDAITVLLGCQHTQLQVSYQLERGNRLLWLTAFCRMCKTLCTLRRYCFRLSIVVDFQVFGHLIWLQGTACVDQIVTAVLRRRLKFNRPKGETFTCFCSFLWISFAAQFYVL